jgi:hypothetical protein
MLILQHYFSQKCTLLSINHHEQINNVYLCNTKPNNISHETAIICAYCHPIGNHSSGKEGEGNHRRNGFALTDKIVSHHQ